MSRTVRWVGVGLLFSLGLGVDGMQAQQPVAAEPQAPSRTVQTPPELVPTLPVPRLVKFAGVFKEEQGKARTGVVGVTLAIYKDQEGGAALWVETQNVELDEQGRYTVLLGSTKSEGLPLELFTTGEPRWLGVQVNLPKEMEQSRVLLVSVPYALKAADAESLGGKPASSYALAPTGIATGTDNGGTGGTNTSTGAQAGTGKKSTKAGATPAVVTANFIPMFTDNAGTLGNSLLVQSGNSMGLGQGAGANATVQFDVNGGVRGTGLATAGRNVAPDAINTNALFLNGSNAMGVIGTSNAVFAPGALFTKTSFYSGGAERMTVDGATGNVGIGTATPGQKLSVVGMIQSTTGGFVFPDATVQTTAAQLPAASLVRAITYLAGCDSCGLLTTADSENTIFLNVIGSMTVNSVTCFSDAGAPTVNIQRNQAGTLTNILSANLTCSATGATSSSFSTSLLSLNDSLNFIIATADGVAKRVTVIIKATVN